MRRWKRRVFIILVSILFLEIAGSVVATLRNKPIYPTNERVSKRMPQSLVLAPIPVSDVPLQLTTSWDAKKIYLPVTASVISGFQEHEMKQRKRITTDPSVLDRWRRSGRGAGRRCSQNTPECDFWLSIPNTTTLRLKCCAEHSQLKETLFYTLDMIDAFNIFANASNISKPIQVFLDSGSLLSSVRDGGLTLVPWETDIDLGVVGGSPYVVGQVFGNALSDPRSFRDLVKNLRGLPQSEHRSHFSEVPKQPFIDLYRRWAKTQNNSISIFRTFESASESAKVINSLEPPHLFELCSVKKSANNSRDGSCRDAHYIYFVKSQSEARNYMARVEIWPFREDGDVLVHPTRPKLSVQRDVVLPLDTSCRLWGRLVPCPAQRVQYLDHEYGPSWRTPKTIHWGKKNVLPWKLNSTM